MMQKLNSALVDNLSGHFARIGEVARVIDVTARAFGAKGDGTADDAAAIQTAFDAAPDNERYTVYIPQGTYILGSGLTIGKNVNLLCQGVLQAGAGISSGATLVNWSGAVLESGITVSSITVDSDENSQITVSGDYSAYAGNYLRLNSTSETNPNLRTDNDEFDATAAKRDFVKILSATYGAPNTTLITQRLENDYSTPGDITAVIVDQIEGVEIAGLDMVGNSNVGSLLIFEHLVNSRVSILNGETFATFGIQLKSCRGNEFANLRITKPTGTDGSGSPVRWGYGFTCSFASSHNTLRDSYGESLRHFFNIEQGSHHNTAQNNEIYGSKNFAILLGHGGGGELHNAAIENTIVNGHGGVFADFPGHGTHIIGNKIHRARYGVDVYYGDGLVITNNTIRTTYSTADTWGMSLRGVVNPVAGYNQIFSDGLGVRLRSLQQDHTTTASGASSGASSITVQSGKGSLWSAGDSIFIKLDGGAIQWTTVASVSTDTINLDDTLNGNVASGNTVSRKLFPCISVDLQGNRYDWFTDPQTVGRSRASLNLYPSSYNFNNERGMKIHHGSVTGGPFEVWEKITGGTSGSTGYLISAADSESFVIVIGLSGPFQHGETITGNASGASATIDSDGARAWHNYHQVGETERIVVDIDLTQTNNAIGSNPILGYINHRAYIEAYEYFAGSGVSSSPQIQVRFVDASDVLHDGLRVRTERPVTTEFAEFLFGQQYSLDFTVVKPFYASSSTGTGIIYGALRFQRLPRNAHVE